MALLYEGPPGMPLILCPFCRAAMTILDVCDKKKRRVLVCAKCGFEESQDQAVLCGRKGPKDGD